MSRVAKWRCILNHSEQKWSEAGESIMRNSQDRMVGKKMEPTHPETTEMTSRKQSLLKKAPIYPHPQTPSADQRGKAEGYIRLLTERNTVDF